VRWSPARLVERVAETPTAATLTFELAQWPGHLAGQHVDVRLRAEDGYTAQRSYSLAAPADGHRVAITVQALADGEVSPFLVEDLQAGDELEIRGPLGGWFVWRAEQREPVLLVAGGSGVVPLMAMLRARAAADSAAPFRLVYSVRSAAEQFYAAELTRRAREDAGFDLALAFTRSAPEGAARPVGRITAADLDAPGWRAADAPRCYVCGSTPFVEAVADLLVAAGHDAARIHTERYGG
jgi:ferredoxin-NADP reductase